MNAAIASTREAFVSAMLEAARNDPSVLLVCADSIKAARATPFQDAFPKRTFDVGIAEQNAVAFAAGLASCGYKPFVNTYAGFITMRACEQVRVYAGYTQLPVKFAGLNGGVYGGEREGVTHQFFEDLGILRTIPGIDIVIPADASQARKATLALLKRPGPGYLRLGSGREPVIFTEADPFEFGRIRVISRLGRDVALIANGPVLKRVLIAADKLAAAGIRATVIEVHTLKPFDGEGLAGEIAACGAAVTVEDHNIIGALGSATAEVMAARGMARTLLRMGVQDTFPRSGAAEDVLDYIGLSVDGIFGEVSSLMKSKA